MKITNIAVHHSGGIGSDNFASSAYLTAKKIALYHKKKWNFTSTSNTDPILRYGGYNVVIETDGSIHWSRAIGEMTAAQKGYNHNTFSICIVGNFNKRPGSKDSVDVMTGSQYFALKRMLINLVEHNFREKGENYIPIIDGAEFNFSVTRIQPHRFYGNTECYGTGLPNYFAQNIIRDYYAEKYGLSPALIAFYVYILDKFRTDTRRVGTQDDDRGCEGHL